MSRAFRFSGLPFVTQKPGAAIELGCTQKRPHQKWLHSHLGKKHEDHQGNSCQTHELQGAA